jgi:hypothetical protein
MLLQSPGELLCFYDAADVFVSEDTKACAKGAQEEVGRTAFFMAVLKI